jgi:hypothetical protein
MRYVLAFLAATVMCVAQQLPNSDLEEWTLFPSSNALFKDYEEPSGGVWSSGNGVAHIAPNSIPPTTKTTDAHSGQFAARLETQTVFGQIASGSLFTGRFELDLGNPRNSAKLGVPFSALPMRFRGWYKYQPVNGDSCSVNCELTRWDTQSQQRVTIARARSVYRDAAATWTEFDLPLQYSVQGVLPDSITMSFASSAGAEFLKGVQGSTMHIDDLSLVYDPVSVHEPVDPEGSEFQLIQRDGLVHLISSSSLRYRAQAYDLMGRIIPCSEGASVITFNTSEYRHAVLFIMIEDLQTHSVTIRTCYFD